MATRTETYASRLTPEVLRAVDGLVAAAKQRGVSSAALAVAWILRNSNVSTVLSGPSRHEQLQAFVEAPELTLNDELLAEIDSFSFPEEALVRDF
jgi:aryl-alcohol dehydrogenase-like predicted oxidoreductase